MVKSGWEMRWDCLWVAMVCWPRRVRWINPAMLALDKALGFRRKYYINNKLLLYDNNLSQYLYKGYPVLLLVSRI